MMAAKHTPGPHVLHAGSDGAWQIEDERGRVLCTRNPWPHNAEESAANGRLFGNAAALLEMVRELQWIGPEDTLGDNNCPVCGVDEGDDHSPDCRLAAVIAAAEGPGS